MDLNDEALIVNFRATRQTKYFQYLVSRYQNRLFNTAFRMIGNTQEAEEIVQEVFLRVVQNLDSFQQKTCFAAWIFKIAHNLCVDSLRSKYRRGTLQNMPFDPQLVQEQGDNIDYGQHVVTQIADRQPGPAQYVENLEKQSVIAASLEQLPQSQKEVLVLHDIEGFSYQEIAEIVGTSIGTVRSRLYYARQKMRDLLTPYVFQNPCTSSFR